MPHAQKPTTRLTGNQHELKHCDPATSVDSG
jgi:hypothetical protein